MRFFKAKQLCVLVKRPAGMAWTKGDAAALRELLLSPVMHKALEIVEEQAREELYIPGRSAIRDFDPTAQKYFVAGQVEAIEKLFRLAPDVKQDEGEGGETYPIQATGD